MIGRRFAENFDFGQPLMVVRESFQDDLPFRTFYSAPECPRTILYSVQPSSKHSVNLTNDWQIFLTLLQQFLQILCQSFQNGTNGHSSGLNQYNSVFNPSENHYLWIWLEIWLQLGMMSAMSLASLGKGGGNGDDEKVKEEKTKTEAERQKNGK